MPIYNFEVRGVNVPISSKNIIDGEAVLALRNKSRIERSLSPTHLENSSGPLTARKFRPLSVANALAIIVLAHPGGPYISRPEGGLIPILKKGQQQQHEY